MRYDVLIRGMAMPECCFDCPIFDNFCQERCGVTGTLVYGEIDPQRETLPDCPLVPLPERHGRLIDAEALQAKFELMENAFAEHGRPYSFAFKDGGEMCAEWWTVQDALAREPTIIEAEGGGEDGK